MMKAYKYRWRKAWQRCQCSNKYKKFLVEEPTWRISTWAIRLCV